MHDPHDEKDHDVVIIKPMTFTGTILLSAGAGLAAGLLICWLFGSDVEQPGDGQAITTTIENSSGSNSQTGRAGE